MINGISANALSSQIDKFKNLNLESSLNNNIEKESNSDFSKMLGNLIQNVDKSQKSADISLENLATGKNNTTIQEVVMKMDQAEIAFSLMKEIRNKLLSAYKDILKL